MTYAADGKRYGAMKCRRSGKSGVKMSALSLGFWHNCGGNADFASQAMTAPKFSADELKAIDEALTARR